MLKKIHNWLDEAFFMPSLWALAFALIYGTFDLVQSGRLIETIAYMALSVALWWFAAKYIAFFALSLLALWFYPDLPAIILAGVGALLSKWSGYGNES